MTYTDVFALIQMILTCVSINVILIIFGIRIVKLLNERNKDNLLRIVSDSKRIKNTTHNPSYTLETFNMITDVCTQYVKVRWEIHCIMLDDDEINWKKLNRANFKELIEDIITELYSGFQNDEVFSSTVLSSEFYNQYMINLVTMMIQRLHAMKLDSLM